MKRTVFVVMLILCAVLMPMAVHNLLLPVQAQSVPTSSASYKYISSATTTAVKPALGFLHTVTINGGIAGVVTLYDINGVGCTGTPASGKFATIGALPTAPTPPVTVIYDLEVQNGLCVVTAAATDLTVSFN